MKIHATLLPAIAAFVFAADSAAQETRFSLSTGVTHTDNVERTSVGEESDTIVAGGVQFTLQRTGRLETDVAADLRYLTYLDDTSDDELVGGLNGSLSYAFVPDRLMWVIDNDFGQSLIDSRDVESPANREKFNSFSTGPTVVLPLGSRTELSISGRWTDVYYEESDLDSERLTGEIALSRAINDTSTLSLNASSQRVEYDESPPSSNYDLHSAFLRYEVRGARTTLEASGGLSRLYDFGQSSDGPLFDLTLTRELGARSSFELNIGTRFFAADESFVRESDRGGVSAGTEAVVAASDLMQQDYATTAWTFAGARTTLQISADWRNDDREVNAALDRESLGFGLDLSRRVGPRTTVSLIGRHTNEQYDNDDLDYDEWSAGIGLDWSLSGSFGLGLRADHFEGSGDTTAGSGTRDYEENRYTLSLTYSAGR